MVKPNRIVIDSSDAYSELCLLGAEHGTDKSPYAFDPPGRHRHGYTGVYDLLFASKRFEPIVLGEIGVLDNRSMRMWRDYFPLAALIGFDAFVDKLDAARADGLHNARYYLTDVGNPRSLEDSFIEAGARYDILIDDSTHLFDDQVRVVRVATKYIKPGGFLIVEDVFRSWPEERYTQALADLAPYFCLQTFLVTDHRQGYSQGEYEPYFDNDKLLVMVRNQRPWSLELERNAENVRRLRALQEA